MHVEIFLGLQTEGVVGRSKERSRKIGNGHCVARNQQRRGRSIRASSSSSSSPSKSALSNAQALVNTGPYEVVSSTKADSSKARIHSQETDLNISIGLVPTKKTRSCRTVKQRKSTNNRSTQVNRSSRSNNRSLGQLRCEKPLTSQNGLQILAAVATTISFIDRSHLLSLSEDSFNDTGVMDIHDKHYPDDDVETRSASNYYSNRNFSSNLSATQVVESRLPCGSDRLEEILNCSNSESNNALSTVFDRKGCYNGNVNGCGGVSETGFGNVRSCKKAKRLTNKVCRNVVSETNLDNARRTRGTMVHPFYKIAFHSLLTPSSGLVDSSPS